MAVYLIADVTVTDEAWIAEYATNVHDIAHKHGGKYLSRSANISTVEGEPCKADMVTLRNLVAKYGRQGFSVIGVNVDMETDKALAYLKKERFSWANVHEPGGLESRPATELGVLTLPTMLLIDDKGRVVNRNIHVSELETELKNRIR